jgi:hypothetical protein
MGQELVHKYITLTGPELVQIWSRAGPELVLGLVQLSTLHECTQWKKANLEKTAKVEKETTRPRAH